MEYRFLGDMGIQISALSPTPPPATDRSDERTLDEDEIRQG